MAGALAQTVPMTRDHAGLDLDALLQLWASPPSEREDAHADFAALYADPVVINDRPTSIADLVARAEAVHTAFADQTAEVLEVVADGDLVAFSFKREVTHTGTWNTPVGDLPPSGARVTLTGMDILTIEDGRVARIRVLADDLAVLAQAAGARLTTEA
jgi:predicted ester cyclase